VRCGPWDDCGAPPWGCWWCWAGRRGRTRRRTARSGPPELADITHPATGEVLDGLFWHRYAITQRGQAALPNVAGAGAREGAAAGEAAAAGAHDLLLGRPHHRRQ